MLLFHMEKAGLLLIQLFIVTTNTLVENYVRKNLRVSVAFTKLSPPLTLRTGRVMLESLATRICIPS